VKPAEEKMREQLRKDWPEPVVPAFDDVWRRAGRQWTVQRRRYAGFASVAAAAAIAALLFGGNGPHGQPDYVEVADLLEKTYWTAPSDTLMPEYQFDIYQEMPVLFEST
jgi:hypothetical protein